MLYKAICLKQVFSILAVLLSFIGYGQEEERKGLFSVYAGYTLCTLNGANFDVAPRSDFHVGIRKDVELSTSTHLNTGILYSGLGAKVNREFSEDDLKIQTLQLPIGIKQYLGSSVFITGGGSVNLRLGARVNRDAISGETKFFDIAVSLGTGFNVKRFTIDARWNYGLINIKRNDGRISGNNQYIFVGLGYRISS